MSAPHRRTVCPPRGRFNVPLTADCERIFRPDKIICTRTHRVGADNLVRTREQSALDDARYIEFARRACERFVTVSRQSHVHLAFVVIVEYVQK